MSSKNQDTTANSTADVTEIGENEKTAKTQEEILAGYAVEVNGKTLAEYESLIHETWNVSTLARLKVGMLLSIVVDNKMLDGIDVKFSEWVQDQFSIKPSYAYLLVRVWADKEIRLLVQDHAMPLEASGNALSLGTKYGTGARKELTDYALVADGTVCKSANVLRRKAVEIRTKENAPAEAPAPASPSDELRAALSVQRVLAQERTRLMSSVKAIDVRASANNDEIARLTILVKSLAGDVETEPETEAEPDQPNATRAAMIMATKHNVDLDDVTGSLAGGRVNVQDVRDAIKAGQTA